MSSSSLAVRLKLSVLDQSVAVSGRTQAEAIGHTLQLAQHCEALGYHRFWVSEHHSHPTLAGSAPEILMAAIAVTTQRIRTGSAGVLLPHHAALDQYRQLYRPSPRHPLPQPVLCLWALAADTEAEAWHHFSSRERWKINRNTGALGSLLSPEEVAQRPNTPVQQAQSDAMRRTALVGTGAQVAARLQALADTLNVAEISVITWTHDPAAARRSYELCWRKN